MQNDSELEMLAAGLSLFNEFNTYRKVADFLSQRGSTSAIDFFTSLQEDERDSALDSATELLDRGIRAVYTDQSEYPRTVEDRSRPALLFVQGDLDLLNEPAVGMCGSRAASERGMAAARKCGAALAAHGLAVVSGYARGVDCETHLGALQSGGRTVIVLAEGINHFRKKNLFGSIDFHAGNVSVISQFAPNQSWNVGAAMARNSLIWGVGKVLVVIEAQDTGGTLQAGMGALKAGRPVLALDFAHSTPIGNEILIQNGAIRVSSTAALGRALEVIEQAPQSEPIHSYQLTLLE